MVSSSIYNIRIVINYYYFHSKTSMKPTVIIQDYMILSSSIYVCAIYGPKSLSYRRTKYIFSCDIPESVGS